MPEYEAPGFTDLDTVHTYEEDHGEALADLFDYAFTIQLKDADTDKPLNVRLQYGNIDGSGYTDVISGGDTRSTLSYSGSGSVWKGNLLYDMRYVDPGEKAGILQQMRIVCDYTLKDGTEGTIYSTNVGKLFAYGGRYLNAESGEYTAGAAGENGSLHAVFTADTSLVRNTAKLSTAKVTLHPGYGEEADITDHSDVTVNNDGTISVTYQLRGDEPPAEEQYYLALRMTYTDADYGVDGWQSADEIGIGVPHTEVPEPPVFTDAQAAHKKTESGSVVTDLFDYAFAIDLNDIDKDVTQTLKLQYADYGSGVWKDVTTDGSTPAVDYTGTADEWTGNMTYNVTSYAEGDGAHRGILHNVRMALDYTLTDGTEGTVYSTDVKDLYAYAGEYLSGESAEVTINADHPYGILNAVFKIDTALVKSTAADKLIVKSVSINPGYDDDIDITDKADVIFETDGTVNVTYEMNGEEPEQDGEYRVTLKLSYSDFDGAVDDWQSSADTNFDKPVSYHAPEFENLYSLHTRNPGIDEEYWDMFGYFFTLNLNDAEASDLKVRLEYDSYDGSAWKDVPAAADTVGSLTYEGSGPVWESTEADENILVYDIYDIPTGEKEGMLWYVRIACDYTFPDGRTGTVYSTDNSALRKLTAYKGDYIAPVSGSFDFIRQKIHAVYQLDTDLVKDADVISYEDSSTTDKTEYYVTWELHLEWGPGMYERLDLEGTAIPEIKDGQAVIDLELSDFEIDREKDYALGLGLYYTEQGRNIAAWESFARVNLQLTNLPTGVVKPAGKFNQINRTQDTRREIK